ncbi:hypothetical protein SEUCBS139899_010116 [Sporothrix eucalyptigena]
MSSPAVRRSASPRQSLSPTATSPRTTSTTRTSLQQLLPTCQRCRRLRRKCDTQLPHCRPCQRVGVECLLFDHALKQTLPRAYVQSLLTRVEHLEAVKASGRSTAGHTTKTSTVKASTVVATPPSSSATTQASPAVSVVAPDGHPHSVPSPTYDVVVPSASSAGKSRYWGASSVFALTVEILQHATARGYQEPGSDIDADADAHARADAKYAEADVNAMAGHLGAATEADIRSLLQLYLVSSNTLYGFVDPDQVQADLEVYLAVRRQRSGQSPTASLGDLAHPYFRIAMMCAIACATRARYRPQRTAESLSYYAAAVPFVEEVTAEVSPASLQALLLLILFCLFFPRKGDVWKLLDYACRLALELGYHTEVEEGHGPQGHLDVPDVTDPALSAAPAPQAVPSSMASQAEKLRRATFWGLYAIERIVGQLFGRGSDLPESIVTVAYPSALVSAAATSPGVDRTALQEMSIAHHYRLVYLRSEIFRTMYLPAGRPVNEKTPTLGWLRQQYQTLRAWRDELALPEGDAREGVATLTCDVGYDATMCFLFQPLLLRALRGGGGGDAVDGIGADSVAVVASDPFYSSLRLIRTYEKIVRAPETSVLGSYPMTFMSAHYIYLASSTLLAHALLRLDGRTRTLKRMGDGSEGDDGEELDWGMYVDASSSCLILLAWCGERWPGMLGMLGVYQKLFARTVRELIRRGILK